MRFRSRFVVDLNILESNFQCLKEICPNNDVLFMVKANAYGHGLLPIVEFSQRELGLKEFGCATLGEALYLRDELNDREFEIYVFSDIQIELKECSEHFLNKRIIPVISNMADLDYFLTDSRFKNFPLVLKFNTGMNRLGIDHTEVDRVVKKIKANGRNSIHHLMTHFANASMSMHKNKRNIFQLENFKQLKSTLISSGIALEKTSTSNSGSIEQGIGLEESHVRPGLIMYGPSSLMPNLREKSLWKGRVISQLETYVIRTFKVEKGQPVGYGATPCPENGIIAILALGYGDGFSTRYQGARFFHRGKEGRVMGRVNMDMIQVFFQEDDLSFLTHGDKFNIWDHNNENLYRLSDETATIPYEIFCSITGRVPKVYEYSK